MATVTVGLQKKSLDHPDEVRSFPKALVEVVRVGDLTLMRARFEPGWRWSEHMKPRVGTQSCEVAHVGYVISGHLMTRLNDGTELESKPGDFVVIPPGHDGWVVGNEPAVLVDFVGGEDFGRR